MIELELSNVMKRIVEDHVELRAQDGSLVITDAERFTLGKALATACRATGSDTVLLTIPKTKNQNAEPPSIVGAALSDADVAFYITTHSLTHTDAYRNAKENGTLLIGMRETTADMFTEGAITTDFEELDELTKSLKEKLNDSQTVRVTNPSGTDITFDITDRPAFALGYHHHDFNGNIGSFTASGEAALAPAPNSANGKIVIDHAMDNIGFVDEPIELVYKDGELVDIDGGLDAATLEEIITEADENAGNLAEFAIGTNKDARLTSKVAEAKKKLGTVHFAVGDSASLGGDVKSDIHLDGIVLDTSIYLDGEQIMDEGILTDE